MISAITILCWHVAFKTCPPLKGTEGIAYIFMSVNIVLALTQDIALIRWLWKG